jgi:hypothetical protein
MPPVNLILTLPQSALVATSLSIDELGWHRSPGSAKYFHGRSIFLELAHENGTPKFNFLEEGGWRDANGDTKAALGAILAGKRTKTALSNTALNATPVDALKSCHLVKTSGRGLQLDGPKPLYEFPTHACDESLSPAQVAERIGRPQQPTRPHRFFMILAPVEMLVLSDLTPIEYAWYATHRPGKVFRSVAFAELVGVTQRSVVAEGVLQDAITEISTKGKKTKTLTSGDLLNRVPFQDWVGYGNPTEGGLYVADRNKIAVWRFPQTIPSSWSRAEG